MQMTDGNNRMTKARVQGICNQYEICTKLSFCLCLGPLKMTTEKTIKAINYKDTVVKTNLQFLACQLSECCLPSSSIDQVVERTQLQSRWIIPNGCVVLSSLSKIDDPKDDRHTHAQCQNDHGRN